MAIPLLGIFSTLAEGVVNHFKHKNEIKQAETEGRIAVITKAADNVADWEKLQAQGSQNSWKDEYWTIVLSIPAIMSFVPGLVDYVAAGFAALQLMPDWYQWILLGAIGASFGIRVKDSLIGKK